MAKVTGPLMSMSASGTVGGTITFDKRGFVRNHVIPQNPQTASQGNTRQKLLAIQKALKVANVAVIDFVKAIAPTSYRWNSFLLASVIGPSSADYDASKAAFEGLAGTGPADWNARAATGGLVDRSILYADDDEITGGLALFATARALYGLGINAADGAPAVGNFDAWGDFFFDGA